MLGILEVPSIALFVLNRTASGHCLIHFIIFKKFTLPSQFAIESTSRCHYSTESRVLSNCLKCILESYIRLPFFKKLFSRNEKFSCNSIALYLNIVIQM